MTTAPHPTADDFDAVAEQCAGPIQRAFKDMADLLRAKVKPSEGCDGSSATPTPTDDVPYGPEVSKHSPLPWQQDDEDSREINDALGEESAACTNVDDAAAVAHRVSHWPTLHAAYVERGQRLATAERKIAALVSEHEERVQELDAAERASSEQRERAKRAELERDSARAKLAEVERDLATVAGRVSHAEACERDARAKLAENEKAFAEVEQERNEWKAAATATRSEEAPRYSRDGGERMTMGELVRKVADALDRGDESTACNAVDELLDGAWSHDAVIRGGRSGLNIFFKADMRGLAVASYREGKARAFTQLRAELGRLAGGDGR